ncbi:MAG: endolytic transglycosylase MltG [Anaerolineae bacterium]|nr:endolytic transglycosylase MltG [Anaerolineae bacterium]
MPRPRRAAPPRGMSAGARVVIVLAVFALLVCACAFAVTRLLAVRIPQPTIPATANLNPLEALYLSTYLGLRAGDLEARMAADAEPVRFEVEPGSSAADIAEQLVRRGLIGDATLFRNYARYTGLDSQLEAGRFNLSAAMTVPEIAQALTEALSPDVIVQVIEGWRMEQVAEAIDAAEGWRSPARTSWRWRGRARNARRNSTSWRVCRRARRWRGFCFQTRTASRPTPPRPTCAT